MAKRLLISSHPLGAFWLFFSWRRAAYGGCMAWLWLWITAGGLSASPPPASSSPTLYQRAVYCFNHEDYDHALSLLEQDRTAKNHNAVARADDLNLQGAVFLRQHRYDEARAVLDDAVRLDPSFWEAQFNVAEVNFHEQRYGQARAQLNALLERTSPATQAPKRSFIEYKLKLIDLLNGNETAAADFVGAHQRDKAPPLAWYYLNAALEYRHRHVAAADGWLQQADAKYSTVDVALFTSSFDGLGWATGVTGGRRAVAHGRSLAAMPGPPAGNSAGVPMKTAAGVDGLIPAFRYSGDGAASAQEVAALPAMRAEFNLPPVERTTVTPVAEVLARPAPRALSAAQVPQNGSLLKRGSVGSSLASPSNVTTDAAATPGEALSPAFVQKYEAAVVEFLRKNYPAAKKLLDEADAIEPNEPQSVGLRHQLAEQDQATTDHGVPSSSK